MQALVNNLSPPRRHHLGLPHHQDWQLLEGQLVAKLGLKLSHQGIRMDPRPLMAREMAAVSEHRLDPKCRQQMSQPGSFENAWRTGIR